MILCLPYTEILGCKKFLADYTVGYSLFTTGSRPFLILGSYVDYAVLTKNQVMRIYSLVAINNYN